MSAQKESPGSLGVPSFGGVGVVGRAGSLGQCIFTGASVNITDVPRSRAARQKDWRRVWGPREGCGAGAGGRGNRQQPALQHSFFICQRGDSSQVFPDFNKFGRTVLFLFGWFFQLVQPLLPSQQLLLKGAL